MKFIFFGNPERARVLLAGLKNRNVVPAAIVSFSDRLVGRKQIITPTAVSAFAIEYNIPLLYADTKKKLLGLADKLAEYQTDFFIVAGYGVIMPQTIIDIPTHGTINLHYSLLPKWRGASPVVQQILHDEETVGYSIMDMVAKLDAGDVYYQESWPMTQPIPTTIDLATDMSKRCSKVLPKILDSIISGEMVPTTQDESLATYCTKIAKSDAEIDIVNDPLRTIFLKTQAYTPWPKAFFHITKDTTDYRVVINQADWHNSRLVINSVTISGKKPMTWEQFCHWFGRNPIDR